MARRLSLGWLKPPKVPADGVMSLAEHLRELRWRLLASMIVIVLGMIVSAFFYDELMAIMNKPWLDAQAMLRASNPDLDLQAVISDVTAPLLLALKVTAVSGLIVTSPFWLYQAWAYIVPGLLLKEKKLAIGFLAAAVPLFLFGVAVGYFVLPQGIVVMLQFTPGGINVVNLLNIDNFLNLLIQLMLVFGLGFLMPVFVVALNLVGVVSAAALKRARMYVVFGSFVFASAATPGSDPFSMMALAIPMALLFLVAEAICHANDRRRARKAGTALATPA